MSATDAASNGSSSLNARGALLADGFGRAPLAYAARRAIADGYVNLHPAGLAAQTEAQVCALTGAEAALVVNSHAAALLLMLQTLCAGREVLIPLGQLGCLHDQLRLHDLFTAAGAQSRPVGAVNALHLRDFAEAFTPQTAALLYHQPLHYPWPPQPGTPDLCALAALAQEHGLPLLVDAGAGALDSRTESGLPQQPLLPEILRAGAAAVSFAGDLYLGGPACGMIAGQAALIERLRAAPLYQVSRAGGLTLRALSATLAVWQAGEHATALPLYRLLDRSRKELLDFAGQVAESVREFFGIDARICESRGYLSATAGGGWRNPPEGIFSMAVRLEPREGSVAELDARLQAAGIFGNAMADAVQLELLTILPWQEEELCERLRTLLEQISS